MCVTKKQSMPNFPKNDHFVHPDKRKCVSGGKKCSFFQKFALLFVFFNTRFEIYPFALIPTI